MKILEKYIGKSVILSSLVILACLIGIFSFFSLIENLSEHNSVSGITVFFESVLEVPGLVFDLMPIAALVGALLALGGLTENHELVVIRMAGGAKSYIFRIMLKSASVLVIIAIVAGEFLAPVCQNISSKMTSLSSEPAIQNERIWTKENQTFISVGRLVSDCHLKNVKVHKFSDRGVLEESILAKNGYCIKNGWELNDVESTFFDGDVSRVERAEILIWVTEIDPNLFGLLGLDPEKLGLADLWTYVNYAKQGAQNSQLWIQAFWARLVHPFTIYLMVFLALPIVLMSSRSNPLGRVIFIGVCVGLGFYVFNELSSSFGIAFNLDPIIVSFSPSILMLGIGAWLNVRSR
jgi:lipopolysaccharide export system permease protein